MVAASWKHYSVDAKRPWVLADAKPERCRTFGETKIEHARNCEVSFWCRVEDAKAMVAEMAQRTFCLVGLASTLQRCDDGGRVIGD